MFEIEKNVPIQYNGKAATQNPHNFPFEQIEIGDSFVVSVSDVGFTSKAGLGHNLRSSVQKLQEQGKLNKSFNIVTKSISDDKLRVWRNVEVNGESLNK